MKIKVHTYSYREEPPCPCDSCKNKVVYFFEWCSPQEPDVLKCIRLEKLQQKLFFEEMLREAGYKEFKGVDSE